MMSTCPKCGDYYADSSLGFCLADGTPLNRVDPSGENWRAGARVIEAKENALRKQMRRLKWRRVLLRAMTAVVVTMVVCVVAINSLIYLRPRPGKDNEPAPPLPPVTTTAQTLVPASSPTSKPKCNVADKSLERKSILKKFGGTWERKIKGEHDQILLANMPAAVANANGLTAIPKPEVTLVTIEFETRFPKDCAASVTARYVWRVTKNVNGTMKEVDIKRDKRFGCVKGGEVWRCG
jgi:hypothetical protein